jgi:hypothetical protein
MSAPVIAAASDVLVSAALVAIMTSGFSTAQREFAHAMVTPPSSS